MDNTKQAQEQKVQEERARLVKLLDEAQVGDRERAIIDPVIDNLSWMKVKLEETREAIKTSGVAVPYTNGRQEGIRQNPLFKGYISLWRAYMTGLEKYAACFPEEVRDEIIDSGVTVLDQVKRMKEAK